MERIYFDHASTTPVDPAVVAVMMPYFTEQFGNVSSPHAFGQATHKALENAREHLAKFIGAKNRWMCLEYGKYGRKSRMVPMASHHQMCSPAVRAVAESPLQRPATAEANGCQGSAPKAAIAKLCPRNWDPT